MKSNRIIFILFMLVILINHSNLNGFTNFGISLVDWSGIGYYLFNDSLEKAKYNYINYVAINLWVYQNGGTAINIYKHSTMTPEDDALKNVIDLAHSKGMKVLLKVNVDDVNGVVWRGNFNPTDRNAWFSNYRTIMTQYARLASEKNVEMFSVGCEFKSLSTITYYSNWTNIINGIRDIFSEKLIYSANWDEYENVPFWGELDYIGIDAYFPLDTNNNATADDVKNDWYNSQVSGGYGGRNWVSEISNFCFLNGKDVFFTEIGYSSADGAAEEPWEWNLTPINLTLQSNLYRGTILAWTNYSWFKGLFWWDWKKSIYSGGPSDTFHTPMNKPAETVLKDLYGMMSLVVLTNTNISTNTLIPELEYPVDVAVRSDKPEFKWICNTSAYDFDWEKDSIMNWYPDPNDKAFSVPPLLYNTNGMAYSGTRSLKCHTVLSQGHAQYDKGNLWFELPKPIDLRGKTVGVSIWVPSSLVWGSAPNGITFVFRDSSDTWRQGSWINITSGNSWRRYSETFSSNIIYSSIKKIGFKIGCNAGEPNDTAFDGYIYVDAYDVDIGTKYGLQISEDQGFSTILYSTTNILSKNYVPLNSIGPDGTYFWRVKAKDVYGYWDDWSEIKKFKIVLLGDGHDDLSPGILPRGETKAYPNPCSRKGSMVFEYGYTDKKNITEVSIDIYNFLGNKIYNRKEYPLQSGKIIWDLKNNDNKYIVPGLYVYKVIIYYSDGDKDIIKYKKIGVSK